MKVKKLYGIGSVVVTGTNRGIGLELVKYFSAQDTDTKVIACSRRLSPELESVVKSNDNVSHVELEVTNIDSVQKAFHSVSNIVGNHGVNLLINNVGIRTSTDVGTFICPEKDLDDSFHINVTGTHTVTRIFYPLIKMAAAVNPNLPVCCARGAILNVSSNLSSIDDASDSFCVAYRVSKAALNMLTKCTANDVIQDNVLCVAIHPGWVKTDMGGGQAPLSTNESVEDIAQIIERCSVDHKGLLVAKDMQIIPF